MEMTQLNFNDAGEQKTFDLIPDRTIVIVQIMIRAGQAGEDGWLKASKDGKSLGLDCEFLVIQGVHIKRKFWERMLISGTTEGHAEAADISKRKLRAILESARGIKPDDKSEAANKARCIDSFGDLDGLRFMVRVGIEAAQGNFKAKNTVLEIITPDRKDWLRIEQDPSARQRPPQQQQATGAIAMTGPRPQWAG